MSGIPDKCIDKCIHWKAGNSALFRWWSLGSADERMAGSAIGSAEQQSAMGCGRWSPPWGSRLLS